MSKLKNWIICHQLISFFVITFAITWGLGFSYGGYQLQGKTWMFPLVAIATCGPALAGIIISAVANTQPKQGRLRGFLLALFVGWIVSAILFFVVITLAGIASFSLRSIGLTFLSTFPVAYVIGSAFSRNPGVRKYLASLVRLHGVWGWALLGLVLIPLLVLLSNLVGKIITPGNNSARLFPVLDISLLVTFLLRFLYQLFFFNATGEEVGWRGIALPRLQVRTSPLVAAVFISLFWVPWHFFLWKAEGAPVQTWQYWVERFITVILFSVIIVWIYNRSNGSILVAGITHAAGNTASALLPFSWQGLLVTLGVAILALVLIDRMWKRLPPDHQGVFQQVDSTE
jgi:membrane protease YdiL (CAAX protease family)